MVRSSRALTVLSLAVAGAAVFLAVRSFAVEAVYPVERTKRTFVDRVFTRIRGMLRGAEARAENARLKREVAALAMVRADNERLEAENTRLRSALGYAGSRKDGWLAASVLATIGGASSGRSMLRLDKGSLEGVVEGAVAAVPDGLVGRVTSVTLHTSVVTLITDSSVKVACEVENAGRTRLRGIIAGGNEETLALRFTVGERKIPPRSRVVTSGVGGVFPKGIEIGTYIDEGEVEPSVDFERLDDVFIRCER